jgi:hypothetical protein
VLKAFLSISNVISNGPYMEHTYHSHKVGYKQIKVFFFFLLFGLFGCSIMEKGKGVVLVILFKVQLPQPP